MHIKMAEMSGPYISSRNYDITIHITKDKLIQFILLIQPQWPCSGFVCCNMYDFI